MYKLWFGIVFIWPFLFGGVPALINAIGWLRSGRWERMYLSLWCLFATLITYELELAIFGNNGPLVNILMVTMLVWTITGFRVWRRLDIWVPKVNVVDILDY